MLRQVITLPVLLMVGIYGVDSSCGGDPEPTPWDVPGVDYSAPGPLQTSSASSTFAAPSGCELPYTEFLPAGDILGPLVVLSHGFQRKAANMADLGAQLASWGFQVVTPDLCHSVPSDNAPREDAEDIIALAAALGADEVAYLGHSAGGMRSVLAADLDPSAVIYHGLDMVDVADIALDEATAFPLLAGGSVGEPSSCNAENNGLAFYESAPRALAYRVSEADHCDFESPTDGMCTSFCAGTNDLFDEDAIHNAIFGLTTSYLLWQTGVDLGGADWWSADGAAFQYLTSIGLVVPVVP